MVKSIQISQLQGFSGTNSSNIKKEHKIILKAFLYYHEFYKVGDTIGVIRPLQFKVMEQHPTLPSDIYNLALKELIELGYFFDIVNSETIALTDKGYNFLKENL